MSSSIRSQTLHDIQYFCGGIKIFPKRNNCKQTEQFSVMRSIHQHGVLQHDFQDRTDTCREKKRVLKQVMVRIKCKKNTTNSSKCMQGDTFFMFCFYLWILNYTNYEVK